MFGSSAGNAKEMPLVQGQSTFDLTVTLCYIGKDLPPTCH